MRQSDLLIDKYWVTQSGYFRLAIKVTLGMSIADGKLLYCDMVWQSEMWTEKFQHWSTTTGRFMTASTIPL